MNKYNLEGKQEGIFYQTTLEGDIKKSRQRKVKEIRQRNIPPEYFNLGIYLIAPLVFFTIAGAFLDNKLNAKGIVIIVSILFGTISMFYNLYKLYKKG